MPKVRIELDYPKFEFKFKSSNLSVKYQTTLKAGVITIPLIRLTSRIQQELVRRGIPPEYIQEEIDRWINR